MTTFTSTQLSSVVTSTIIGAPEDVDYNGWKDGAYDMPDASGIAADANYWLTRLEREVQAWGDPASDARLAQHAFAPNTTEAYYEARAARSALVVKALRSAIELTPRDAVIMDRASIGYGGVYQLFIGDQLIGEFVPGQVWSEFYKRAQVTYENVTYTWRAFE